MDIGAPAPLAVRFAADRLTGLKLRWLEDSADNSGNAVRPYRRCRIAMNQAKNLETVIECVPRPRRWPTTKPVEMQPFYSGADSQWNTPQTTRTPVRAPPKTLAVSRVSKHSESPLPLPCYACRRHILFCRSPMKFAYASNQSTWASAPYEFDFRDKYLLHSSHCAFLLTT